MVCVPCRRREHLSCDNLTKAGYETNPKLISVNEITILRSNNWCDCQHVTEGTNINPEFKTSVTDGRV